jgi:hypothetical protein
MSLSAAPEPITPLLLLLLLLPTLLVQQLSLLPLESPTALLTVGCFLR